MEIKEIFKKYLNNKPSSNFWESYNSRVQTKLNRTSGEESEFNVTGPVFVFSRLKPFIFTASFLVMFVIVCSYLSYLLSNIDKIKIVNEYVVNIENSRVNISRLILKNMVLQQIVEKTEPVLFAYLETSCLLAEQNNKEELLKVLNKMLGYYRSKYFIPAFFDNTYSYLRKNIKIPGLTGLIWAYNKADILLESAVLAEQNKKLSLAQSYYERVIKECPADYEYFIAKILLKENIHKQNLMKRINKAKGYELTKINFLLGNYDELANITDNYKVSFIKAYALKESGRYKESARAFKELSESPTVDKDVKIASVVGESYSYLKGGDTNKAVSSLENLKNYTKEGNMEIIEQVKYIVPVVAMALSVNQVVVDSTYAADKKSGNILYEQNFEEEDDVDAFASDSHEVECHKGGAGGSKGSLKIFNLGENECVGGEKYIQWYDAKTTIDFDYFLNGIGNDELYVLAKAEKAGQNVRVHVKGIVKGKWTHSQVKASNMQQTGKSGKGDIFRNIVFVASGVDKDAKDPYLLIDNIVIKVGEKKKEEE